MAEKQIIMTPQFHDHVLLHQDPDPPPLNAENRDRRLDILVFHQEVE